MTVIEHKVDLVHARECVAAILSTIDGRRGDMLAEALSLLDDAIDEREKRSEQLRGAVSDVTRLRLFLEDISNTKSIDLAQGMALLALSGAPHAGGQ